MYNYILSILVVFDNVWTDVSSALICNTLAQCYRKNELKKKRAYEERVREIEHGSFSPLVFSAAGGMGTIATVVYKRLASLLAEKQGRPYSSTLHWLRCI